MRSEMGERRKVEIASFLRRLLNDLEAGKVVRVALDLQALIQELEEEPSQKHRGAANGSFGTDISEGKP